MIIPDYVTPILGYRLWKWDGCRLASLNCESWNPRQALQAICRSGGFSSISALHGRSQNPSHEAPQMDCTCGIYATKTADSAGVYTVGASGGIGWIGGEVYLWGKVIEHSRGWRAEFAYPKRLFVSASSFCTLVMSPTQPIVTKLKDLTAYGADIFLLNEIPAMIPAKVTPLWSARSGYDATGIRRLQEARIEPPILTPEEFHIIKLVSEGCSDREISERMDLSQFTVRGRLFCMYEKFGISNRSELSRLLEHFRPSRFQNGQKPN